MKCDICDHPKICEACPEYRQEKNENYVPFHEVITLDKENDILIIDPFIINMDDVKLAGIKNVVRIRRVAWGKGNLGQYLHKIKAEDLRTVIEGMEEHIPYWGELKHE